MTTFIQWIVLHVLLRLPDTDHLQVFRRTVHRLAWFASVCKGWRKEIYDSKKLFRALLQTQLFNIHDISSCARCIECQEGVLPYSVLSCHDIGRKFVRRMCVAKMERIQVLMAVRSVRAMLSNSLQESASMCMEHIMCTFLAGVVNAVYVSRTENAEQGQPPLRRVCVLSPEHIEKRCVWFCMGHGGPRLPCVRLVSAAFGVLVCDLRAQVTLGDELFRLNWRLYDNDPDNPRTWIIWDDNTDDHLDTPNLRPVPFEEQLEAAAGMQTYSNVLCKTIIVEAGMHLICTWDHEDVEFEQIINIGTSHMRKGVTRVADTNNCRALERAGLAQLDSGTQFDYAFTAWQLLPPLQSVDSDMTEEWAESESEDSNNAEDDNV